MTLKVKYMGEYNYVPSVGAASVFAVLFAASTFYHTFQLSRTRTWFFIAFTIGGYFEVAGYIARAISGSQYPDYELGPIAVQTILILIAPSLFAASIYMTLGRIIIITGGEQFSPVRRSWLTKLFVLGDIIAFLTQAGGAAILVQQKASSFSTGETVIKIGLIIQVIFFGLFILTSVLFHVRLVKSGFAERYTTNVPWRRHMHALYIGSVFIFIRCIFRLVEYDQGTTGTLLQHEYWVYIFDAAMMLIVMAVFNWNYPSEVTALLKGSYRRGSGTELPLHG
ncbi:RTA1 domain-containing protein [Aspergillus fijiensis CBS 313.89]|uniref:RTA1 like protein n=1 Tax=Aspergillus fijiensis CBS 313.89 TaxID=1448319 RepID=A0A8G1RZC0_9EURO|nr:RTA1 like protein [Aspergillus fijiensis CBS 313.89]RAK81522.1 RTA1 like protein [Aspergillus fijiensis CBS 313.89]